MEDWAEIRRLHRAEGVRLRPVREPDAEISVEQRPLTHYDTVLGVELDGGGFAS